MGLTEARLVDLDICPEGGSNHALRFGVSGPMTIELGDGSVEVEVAAFQWWWEDYMSQQEGSSQWTERDQAVAAIRLPADVPHLTIGQGGRLAPLGAGWGDDLQVESEVVCVNRRFDVADHGTEPELVVRLLSPGLQQILVEDFDGRDVELVGDVLLLAGDASAGPLHEPELHGIVAQLPGVRPDAAQLHPRAACILPARSGARRPGSGRVAPRYRAGPIGSVSLDSNAVSGGTLGGRPAGVDGSP